MFEMDVTSPAIIFLFCVLGLLFLVILLFLYIKQIACCRRLPKPLCLSDVPRVGDMDESDEELFDKYEDLMNNCTPTKDKLNCIENVEIKVAPLNAPADFDEPDSSTADSTKVPALQLSLLFMPSSGILQGRVLKGQYLQLKKLDNDCYVKISLCSDAGYQLGHMDTKKVTNEMHPTFGDEFRFEIPLYQIKTVTLVVSVYNKVSLLNKEMVGWMGFGCFNSSPEQMSHWLEILNESRGTEVVRWHKLMAPDFLQETHTNEAASTSD